MDHRPKDLMRMKKRRKVFNYIKFGTGFGFALSRNFIRRKTQKMSRKEETPSGWSKLCPDVLRKIMETLSLVDSHVAKLVCLDWFSVWKTCANRLPCPLRIIHHGGFPEEDRVYIRKNDMNYYGYGNGVWFDPKRNDKLYKINLVRNFEGRYCMASCGSWLLMNEFRSDFHLLNLLTLKRINLPSIKSPIASGNWKNSALLWINEATGDYVVAFIASQHNLFSHKKGSRSWRNLKPLRPESGFLDVAYKNSKLYVLTTDQHIKIYDFYGDFPEENRYWNHVFRFDEKPWEYIWKRKIAIDESGRVLMILSLKEVNYDEERLLFYVFKMNFKSCKWERVYSIGDNEMLIFGHGVTVRAPVRDCFGDGTKSGLIHFTEDDVWPDNQEHEDRSSDYGVFDIATSRIEWTKKSCFYINKTQWFVPGVAY